MRLLTHLRQPTNPRRGAALMLSFLVLIVLILIVQQISYSTRTDERVSRNEETLIAMDQAIESILLQVYEDLLMDAGSGDGGDAGGGDGNPFGGGGGDASGFGGDGGGATDSREDDWARPQRTELNELQIRILVQDEDSKFNILSILTEDEEEADKAFERLVRVIEFSRKGTRLEIDGGDARRMATAMLEFMNRRRDQYLPAPELLSDDPENEDIGLPLTLREFVAIDPDLFPEALFKDVRDEDGNVVHAISSFLTTTSSLTTESEDNGGGGGEGASQTPDDGDDGDEDGEQPPTASGAAPAAEPDSADGRINVNTAPPAVLKALLDDREVPYRFWDDVIEFRNEPQEDEEDIPDDEIPVDEYGEEIIAKKFFESLDQLNEIDDWINLEPIRQGELQNLLKVQSSVFSIYITARRATGEERIDRSSRREDIEREEAEGQGLVRTVRSIVWRRTTGGEAEIIPIIRWEVVDYVPYQVLDYPDEDR